MFTGLIESIGSIAGITKSGGANGVWRLRIDAPARFLQGVKIGDSIAVSGACLTVVSLGASWFEAEMMGETARVTKFTNAGAGDRLNLEKALRVGDRLDGHMVTGHVDEVGTVEGIELKSGTYECRISASPQLLCTVAPKGSIAIDGVSLTVIGVEEAGKNIFSVGLIPATLQATTLGSLKPGSRVNLEIDLIARYIARILAGVPPTDSIPSAGVTMKMLAENGWA